MNGGSVGPVPAVAIGQVDLSRPGKAVANGGNDDSAHSSPDVIPTEVYRRTTSGGAIANLYTDDHAESTASVIIGTDMVDPDGAGPRTAPTGVALGAALYSAATDPGSPPAPYDQEAAVTVNHIATLPGIDVRAINMSFGNPFDATHNLNDGNQHLTQFVDWSAREHDVLYVASGYEGNLNPVPKDNFNGIAVAYSTLEGGVYRRVAAGNDQSFDAEGDRTSIGLLAPGDNLDMTGLNAVIMDSGTSFAAPHVTGTAALLLQYANERIANGGWNAVNSRRHETMKAVLMNSADKFIDNGTVIPPGASDPVPQGGLLGMSRTVLKVAQPGNANPTWFDSEAWDDSTDGIGSSVPLDVEMGTGHLNADRARTQFAAGEHDFDEADIPTLGWDYGTTLGAGEINRYQFDGELMGGSFISITLAWDRKVEFATDTAPVGQYNAGDTFREYVDDGLSPPDDSVIDDLDIYLLPKFAGSITQTIASSDSAVGTTEHLFFQIPETGEYEFWVRQHDEDAGVTQNYAVAWWARAELTSTPQGDYDGSGIVDANDYSFWKSNFGTSNASADGNGNGIVDAADYTIWRNHLGEMAGSGGLAAVPEPGSAMHLAVAGVLLGWRMREKPASNAAAAT
ncbi:MAG: S8 family serine peptidase [Pirellulales bacterium]